MKKKLIVLAGPTAVGKTKASIGLAKAIGGEIISADSVQVYKKLNIGSAKISEEEMEGVKHYLIDIYEPSEEFNVAIFKDLVNNAANEILRKGKVPILVGGTGFYIQAVLKDVDFSEGASDEAIRENYQTIAENEGPEKLLELLKEVDPESCDSIQGLNVKRIIRALEYYEVTGKKISEHNAEQMIKESPFDYKYFVLTDDREVLYDRIDKRVDLMMKQGLLDEVKDLFDSGISRDAISMQSLGYRQIMDYLYGDISLDEAVHKIKLQTRHFAKRQLTWFRREKDVIWVDKSDYNRDEMLVLEAILSNLEGWINE